MNQVTEEKDIASEVKEYIRKRNMRLNREDVIELIRINNGSAKDLDLSGCNLSGVNLSKLNLEGIILGTLKIAVVASIEEMTGGANLEGAVLERANFRKANFGRSNLKRAKFYHSDLSEATFWTADMEGADLRETNLTDANLYTAVLKDARLLGTCLKGANLNKANLVGAQLSIRDVGSKIIQESFEDYKKYYERWYVTPDVKNRYKERDLKIRYTHAIEIYLALKNAFLNAGRYDDASKAYFKERQLEKKTFAPWRAAIYYGEKIHKGFRFWSIKWWWFHIKYTMKWLIDWAAELSCGYGEKPLRNLSLAALTLIIFPWLYRISGGIEVADSQMTWLDYFIYSFGAFTTTGFSKYQPITPLAQILTSIEALTGISILALLMFTLGNRISRS